MQHFICGLSISTNSSNSNNRKISSVDISNKSSSVSNTSRHGTSWVKDQVQLIITIVDFIIDDTTVYWIQPDMQPSSTFILKYMHVSRKSNTTVVNKSEK